MANKWMRMIRAATEPRVWAKSKHGGPTSYDGENPHPRERSHLRRLLPGGEDGLPAWAYVVVALFPLIVGALVGDALDGQTWPRNALWTLAAIVLFIDPRRRREVAGILLGLCVIYFLLWFFVGSGFYGF